MKRKNSLIAWSAIGLAMLSLLPVSCKKESEKSTGPYYNAKHITDENKVAMIHSLKDLDGTGRLFEINYDVDYKLDQVLASNIGGTQALFEYIAYLLYDDLGSKVPEVKYGAGCSAFAVDEKAGKDRLMGRNYDFRHFASDGETLLPTSAILVRTAPKGGKKSISMVDGINLGYGKGFLYDENTDLSLLMGLPYAALDGINEDGFAIGVLALREKPTVQSKEGQGKIATTVAIRMLLDKASTVKEAIGLLKGYNMDMSTDGKTAPAEATEQGYSNYHFFMADATGNHAIVEYCYGDNALTPDRMEVFTDNDTLRCVTNFYVSPSMKGHLDGWGSTHGRKRYDIMRSTLQDKNYSLSESEAMNLLQSVAQTPGEELTSMTQWSAVYNLTEKSMRLAILREYGKQFDFKVE